MNNPISPSTAPDILIVEDDEATAEMISLLLAEEHYTTIVADSGEEMMRVLYTLHRLPSLFLLDYRLPDTSGIQLYDYCQSQPELRDIPVVLMSASKPINEIEPRNIVTISKPFDIDDFLSTIDRFLQKDRAAI